MHFRVKGLQKSHATPTPTGLACQPVSKSNNQHQNPNRMCQIFADHRYLRAYLKAIRWRQQMAKLRVDLRRKYMQTHSHCCSLPTFYLQSVIERRKKRKGKKLIVRQQNSLTDDQIPGNSVIHPLMF